MALMRLGGVTTKQIAAAVAAVVIIAVVTIVQTQFRSPSPPAKPATAAAPIAKQAPEPPPASCLLPGPPPVPPNGQTATAADMKLGHDAIQGFVDELEAYQSCRNAQIDRAAPSVSDAQKEQWLEQGNAAIDEANDLKDAFGRQLQAFKARNPG
jgi:hypothetical protein